MTKPSAEEFSQEHAKAFAHTIAGSNDWQDATCLLIDYITNEMQPFSSGGLVAALRTHRPDFRFGQHGLGSFVKDLHWRGSIMYNGQPALQVPRTTDGAGGRTPAGVDVFVYAENQHDGDDFDFEIDIPTGGQFSQQGVAGQGTQQKAAPRQKPAKKAHNFGNDDLFASVQKDSRMRIPRGAFEEFSRKSGHSLRSGDAVYVKVDNDTITVSFDQNSGGTSYALNQNRGAIRFASNTGNSFLTGSTYPIEVGSNSMTIDLNNPQ